MEAHRKRPKMAENSLKAHRKLPIHGQSTRIADLDLFTSLNEQPIAFLHYVTVSSISTSRKKQRQQKETVEVAKTYSSQ